MILIDAVYINNSGGKVLLDYLIEELEKTDLEIYYLLDKRIEGGHPVIKKSNCVQYLDGGILPKWFFYKNSGDRFSRILCFANFPPTRKLPGVVFTYFHQLLFLKTPAELSLHQQLLIRLKAMVLQWSLGNTNFWIVQSNTVEKGLIKRFSSIDKENILILPFYPPLRGNKKIIRVKSSFLYVSTGHPYKNHERLLNSFAIFFEKYKTGELHLTVGKEFPDLLFKIATLEKKGYPIINHGVVTRDNLFNIYRSAEYVIYPSQAESLGLGVVEAIECGCKIIGSDLPWLYAVCEPSIVFNPESTESMFLALVKAVTEDLKISRQLIFNQVEQLIKLLK